MKYYGDIKQIFIVYGCNRPKTLITEQTTKLTVVMCEVYLKDPSGLLQKVYAMVWVRLMYFGVLKTFLQKNRDFKTNFDCKLAIMIIKIILGIYC